MNDGSEKKRSEESCGKLRFSIGQLLVVTAIVSVVLMMLVTLLPPLWALAMENPTSRSWLDWFFGPANWMGLSFRWREYIQRAPTAIVWVVGAILLVRRRQLHPQVSRYALIGLAGLLLLEIVDIGFSVWLTYWVRIPGNAASVVRPYIAVVGPYRWYVAPLFRAGCWVLVLKAVLGWREDGGDRKPVASDVAV